MPVVKKGKVKRPLIRNIRVMGTVRLGISNPIDNDWVIPRIFASLESGKVLTLDRDLQYTYYGDNLRVDVRNPTLERMKTAYLMARALPVLI